MPNANWSSAGSPADFNVRGLRAVDPRAPSRPTTTWTPPATSSAVVAPYAPRGGRLQVVHQPAAELLATDVGRRFGQICILTARALPNIEWRRGTTLTNPTRLHRCGGLGSRATFVIRAAASRLRMRRRPTRPLAERYHSPVALRLLAGSAAGSSKRRAEGPPEPEYGSNDALQPRIIGLTQPSDVPVWYPHPARCLMRSVCSRTSEIPTVTSPAESMARVRVSSHVPGHNTYSTPSASNRAPTSASKFSSSVAHG
jgi:hypothetical protein